MILRCSKCADYRSPAVKYQDEKHGKGRRVHTVSGKTPPTYRCTICEHERSVSAVERKGKKEVVEGGGKKKGKKR